MSYDHLRELYQEIIIDHNRSPRNHHEMVDATSQALGYNPVCGDKLTLYLKVEDNNIVDISFLGNGCAISQASASLMTEALKGQSIEHACVIFERFHCMLTKDDNNQPQQQLEKLSALAGVKAFPTRVKCATLAWHTFHSALTKKSNMVTKTE